MPSISSIVIDDTEYEIKDIVARRGGGGGSDNIQFVTQEEYDELPDTKLTDNVAYAILDYEATHQVKIPVKSGNKTYNGQRQTPFSNVELAKLTITGDDIYQTNSGSYSTTFTPKSGYAWIDGTKNPRTYTWTMEKRTGYITLSKYDMTGVRLFSKGDEISIPVLTTSNINISCESSDPSVVKGYNFNGTKLVLQTQGETGDASITVTAEGDNNNTAASVTLSNITVTENLILTVKLDLSNSSPDSWATYEDDATEFSAGDSRWDTVFGYYPCILEGGEELGKLNPNNYSQYEDGTTAPITTTGKDVMIAFPRMGLKISKDDQIVTVKMTTGQNDHSYEYNAHTYNGFDCDKFYIGAYQGYVASSKLYSISGVTPSSNVSIANYRTYAHSRGSNYEQRSWYPTIFLQCLYLLKYKGKNAQTTIGNGVTSSSSTSYRTTGSSNSSGLNFGTSSSTVKVKIFGIEDFYGTYNEWIDGYITSYNASKPPYYFMYATNHDFSNDPTNYEEVSSVSTPVAGSSYYLKDVIGTTKGGFDIASYTNGSATTYFCDTVSVYRSTVTTNYAYQYGGYHSDGTNAGVFRLTYCNIASAASYCGARLMYFHRA